MRSLPCSISAASLALAAANAWCATGFDAACSAVGALALPQLATISAEALAPGPFPQAAAGRSQAAPTLPAFCRVRGVVEPAIHFEVWLPAPAAWNGRFQAVGGGGLAGVISYPALGRALEAGYATASTDTGHAAPDVEWLGDPARLRDYGYRAIHEMTDKAKAVIEKFYGRAATFNYFNGCSTGGRQGLMEAQRYPDDYDGIVSGAPVNAFVATHVTQLWVALAAKRHGDESILSADDLRLVNGAVLAQCDALDGVEDGLLEDPRACVFDPATLQCAAAAGDACLAPEQIDALRKIYAGPADPRTGKPLHPGLAPGGELAWSLVTSPGLPEIPTEFFRRTVLHAPDWDWRTFDFAEDVARAYAAAGETLDATAPDLGAFRDHGGKLIVYHGWNDQAIFPQGSIDYYANVGATLADGSAEHGAATAEFFRLFMVPGMTHCRGGPGTDQFDAQAAVENWVERGVAPDRIEARHRERGTVMRSRPLCPYPQVASYRGNGSEDSASSFLCAP
jgi:Tannase and feruloyl esterase